MDKMLPIPDNSLSQPSQYPKVTVGLFGYAVSSDLKLPSEFVQLRGFLSGFSQDLIILPRPTSVSQPPKSWDLEYTPLYLSIHSFSVVLSPSTHPEGMMGFL